MKKLSHPSEAVVVQPPPQGPDTAMLGKCTDLAKAFGPALGFIALVTFGTFASLLYLKGQYAEVAIVATAAMALIAGVLVIRRQPQPSKSRDVIEA